MQCSILQLGRLSMFRLAFQKICSFRNSGSAQGCIPLFRFGSCGNAWLLGFLLAFPALCNPIRTAGTMPFDPPDQTFPYAWIREAGYGNTQGSQFPSEWALSSLPMAASQETDGSSLTDFLSGQSLGKNTAHSQESQNDERYPYLLLTGSLILLAFRPLNSSLARRR